MPSTIERSTYVWLSSAVLVLLYWQWRTMPAVIWDVWQPAGRMALWALFWLGWALALAATFMVSHFDLFGLRQVYLAWRGKPYTHIGFHLRWLYRLVRHPLMLGFLIAFWATPTMTAGHLLFSIVMTGYILIATQLEEHDLVEVLGDEYRDYRRKVPGLLPWPRPHPTAAAPQELILEELRDAFQGRPHALPGQVGHRTAGDQSISAYPAIRPRSLVPACRRLVGAQLVTPDAAARPDRRVRLSSMRCGDPARTR